MPQFKRATGRLMPQSFQCVVLQKAQHFVAAIIGLNKRRVRFDIINQPLLLRAEFEEIIIFLQLHHFTVGRIKGSVRQPVLSRSEKFLPWSNKILRKSFL